MTHKLPIHPDRIRTTPPQFSWVDHRLVRDRHLERLSHEAAALYLFLVTVADCQGLSYYSEAAMSRQLKLDPLELAAARQQLERAGLIAYQKPLYQVLALPEVSPEPQAPRSEQTQCVGDILRRALAGGQP